MHNQDKWTMEIGEIDGMMQIEKEFPIVPEKIHGMVLETLENLEKENPSMKKGGNTMKIKKRRVIWAAAALAAMFGTTVAAAELFTWNEQAADYFNDPPKEVQNEMVAQGVVMEQNDSVTDQGITVTVKQTVQDDNRLYILLDVQCEEALIDDNSGFDRWNVITKDPEAFNNMGASFAESAPRGKMEEKNSRGYYEITGLKTYGREWNEDSITLDLGQFFYYTYEEEGLGTSHVIDGNWKLEIPLGEQTQALTKVYEPNSQVMVSGMPVTVKRVEVSPISTVIAYDLNDVQNVIDTAYADEEDVFLYELQLSGFRYDDGETVESGAGGGMSSFWDREAGEDVYKIGLAGMIEPDRVTAILLGNDMTVVELQ